MGETYVETYQGCRIYYLTPPDVEKAVYHSPCVAGRYYTKKPLKKKIDEMFVGPIEPDPDEKPADGLLAQIVAEVKNWFIQNIQSWVETWGQIINNVVTEVTEYVTNKYYDMREYVTEKFYDMREYVTNSYYDFRQYVANTNHYWTEEITKVYNNTYNYITNIIGVTTEWVDNRLADNRVWTRAFFKLMDPTGFLKDPLGTINAAFTIQREIAGTSMVKSFLEGFLEGLEEETEG